MPIGDVAAATTSCSKWLGQAPAELGRGYGEALCVSRFCVCNVEDLFNPITSSYLVLEGATCIRHQSLHHFWCLRELLASDTWNTDNWYVPLWSSSHLSLKTTKKLPLDFLRWQWVKTLSNIILAAKSNLFWNIAALLSRRCEAIRTLYIVNGVKLEISDITDTTLSIQWYLWYSLCVAL